MLQIYVSDNQIGGDKQLFVILYVRQFQTCMKYSYFSKLNQSCISPTYTINVINISGKI